MKNMRRAGMAALVGLTASMSHAAERPDPPGEEMEREHTRHTHPHGEDHATTLDPERFTTNRSSPVPLPLPGEEDAFFFVVYGDRTGGPDEGVSVLKDAVRDTNLLEPDFVMTVGDLIQGYNQRDEWMAQMREYRGIMGELKMPWFPVAGNHDIYWRGPNKPEGEHESAYEMHFGPLWYAFAHKNSWFIVLYSDEGDPVTGDKSISQPRTQTMSPEQLAWLKETLGKASDAAHVFVFLHHPRWRGGNYGSDWDKVHAELVAAGNVSAVFAGHIHRMKYQERDGIEYFALATVGGHQGGAVPEAGMLHHYNIVTVRKDQVAHTAIPVGAALDPRELTEALTNATVQLKESAASVVSEPLTIELDGSASGTLRVGLHNPTDYAVDVALTPESRDSRWVAQPDHTHATLQPGESRDFSFRAERLAGGVDASFLELTVAVDLDLLTEATRYSIPTVSVAVPSDLRLHKPARPARDHVLRVDGSGYLAVPDGSFELADGPMTVEAWLKADGFGRRTGLVCKTESSDYGIFVNDGVPEFSVHLGGAYTLVGDDSVVLPTGKWVHVAGVFDGAELRLYIDGKLVAARDARGVRRTNALPLIVGGDVNRGGAGTSLFAGELDGVRISGAAVYDGPFTPRRRLEVQDSTVLLLNMDGSVASSVFDDSPSEAMGRLVGGAAVQPIDE